MKRNLFAFLNSQTIDFITNDDDDNHISTILLEQKKESSSFSYETKSKTLLSTSSNNLSSDIYRYDSIVGSLDRITNHLTFQVIFKLEIDCNFSISTFIHRNMEIQEEITSPSIEIMRSYCFPCPKESLYINRSIQEALITLPPSSSSTAVLYLDDDNNSNNNSNNNDNNHNNHDKSLYSDPFYCLTRRKSDWQDAIRSVMNEYFNGKTESFLILPEYYYHSDQFVSFDFEDLPFTSFMKASSTVVSTIDSTIDSTMDSTMDSTANCDMSNESNGEYICVIENTSKRIIKRLTDFHIHLFLLSDSEISNGDRLYDGNRLLWSSRGVMDSRKKGDTIVVKGKYSIQVILNIYLEIIVSRDKRRTYVNLPYIISQSNFKNAIQVYPTWKIIKGDSIENRYSQFIDEARNSHNNATNINVVSATNKTKEGDNEDGQKSYRYELSGIIWPQSLLSLCQMIHEHATTIISNKIKNTGITNIPSTAIDISWYEKRDTIQSLNKSTETLTSTSMIPRNPFQVISVPCDIFVSSTTNHLLIENNSFQVNQSQSKPKSKSVDLETFNREEWLRYMQSNANLQSVKYFSINPHIGNVTSARGCNSIHFIHETMNKVIKEIRWISKKDLQDEPKQYHVIYQNIPTASINPYEQKSTINQNLSSSAIVLK